MEPKFPVAIVRITKGEPMAIHLPNAPSPSERVAHYRQLAEAAAKSGMGTPNPEMTEEFFRQAGEWQRLAEEARAELCSASVFARWF
jgi:hypothetical protein